MVTLVNITELGCIGILFGRNLSPYFNPGLILQNDPISPTCAIPLVSPWALFSERALSLPMSSLELVLLKEERPVIIIDIS